VQKFVNIQLAFGLEWWKFLAIALVLYALIGGLLIDVPALPILHETIRNLYLLPCNAVVRYDDYSFCFALAQHTLPF
jgi:hypothetical protein